MKKTLKQQLADAKAKIKRQDELLEAAAKVIRGVAESSAPKWFVVRDCLGQRSFMVVDANGMTTWSSFNA